ncbi:4Fe-4S dicluster domain-containing protein [Candidatus Bathyarchaeota archaeon]|nr:4Fe-4S dicluster domain-containing protein [Candidatus Bathyarchaeota archaeon]
MFGVSLVNEQIQHFLYVQDLKMIVYIGMVLSQLSLFYGINKFFKHWTYNGQKISVKDFKTGLKNALKFGLLQRRVINHRFAGLMHSLIYVSMIGLFITTAFRALDYYSILPLTPLRGQFYLWVKFFANIFGVLAIIGSAMALYRRATKSRKELPNNYVDTLILLDIIIIMVVGFLLDSISTYTYRLDWIGFYDPVGTSLIFLFNKLDPATLTTLYRGLWVFHMMQVFITIAVLPYTKLSHIVIGSFLNTFYAREINPSHPKPVPDILDILDQGKTLGIQKISETDWKQRMDYDSCVQCGRCSNACPANVSGKPLSPMDLMINLREIGDNKKYDLPIWPEIMKTESAWSCVLCAACVKECPFLIDQAETIMELRRGLFFEETTVERNIKQISANISSKGNPYGFSINDKKTWLIELTKTGLCEYAQQGKEYDYLYWIGCVTSYEPAIRKSAESLLKIMKKSGLRVAVLSDEKCCGDPARRIGDELTFTEASQNNYEALQRYKYKKLITNCPHCYNSLKNEYKQYDYNIPIEHYVETIDQLINESKIIPKKVDLKVTYHDSCYLGRWNSVYDSPRKILSKISGIELIEMEKNREKSFCCGGGGGQLFYEVSEGERISKLRIEQAQKTSAETVVVSCPYCNSMFKGENTQTQVMDLLEIIEKSISTD